MKGVKNRKLKKWNNHITSRGAKRELELKWNAHVKLISSSPKLQVGNGSAHSSIQFYSGTGSVGALYFGDGTSGTDRYPGYIEYRHNNNTMAFRVNGTDHVVFLSNLSFVKNHHDSFINYFHPQQLSTYKNISILKI